MNIATIAFVFSTVFAFGTYAFNHAFPSDSPVLNLCQGHGGLAQSIGVGNGAYQKLGYECQDGFGGKVSVK